MSEVKPIIYYCPASDELFEVTFFTSLLATYNHPLSGGAFIHMDTLKNNMIFIGKL